MASRHQPPPRNPSAPCEPAALELPGQGFQITTLADPGAIQALAAIRAARTRLHFSVTIIHRVSRKPLGAQGQDIQIACGVEHEPGGRFEEMQILCLERSGQWQCLPMPLSACS